MAAGDLTDAVAAVLTANGSFAVLAAACWPAVGPFLGLKNPHVKPLSVYDEARRWCEGLGLALVALGAAILSWVSVSGRSSSFLWLVTAVALLPVVLLVTVVGTLRSAKVRAYLHAKGEGHSDLVDMLTKASEFFVELQNRGQADDSGVDAIDDHADPN